MRGLHPLFLTRRDAGCVRILATLPPAEGGRRPPRYRARFDRSLAQFDLGRDFMGEVHAADGEDHPARQLFVALEAAVLDGVAHRLFDLALRGDADLFQKFAQVVLKISSFMKASLS